MAAVDNILNHLLPKDILCQIFSEYLLLQDVSRFEIAICNHEKRPRYLDIIGSTACIWPEDEEEQLSSAGIVWMRTRNMKIRSLKCGTVTYDIAVLIAGFGIYLECLKIYHCSDAIMIKIAEDCLYIKYLCIYICYDITDLSIMKIAECCHDLEFLSVFRCRLSDRSITKLAECCIHIKDLCIPYCSSITDLSMIKIAECCPDMERLNVANCHEITDIGMIKIAECCHNLKDLTIYYCRRITDMGIMRLAEVY
jgi:hypothetical protein